MPNWVPVAVTVALTVFGLLVAVGVYKQIIRDVQKRLDLGDQRFAEWDKQRVADARGEGDFGARLRQVEDGVKAHAHLGEQLARFEGATEAKLSSLGDGVAGMRRDIAAINRILANIAQRGLEWHPTDTPTAEAPPPRRARG